MEKHCQRIQNKINYYFKDISLLETALSHSSYTNEMGKPFTACNERLEFLGDAVLETVSSEILFNKYPEKKEGELSKQRASLVCEASLAYFAKEIELDECIMLGYGEEKTGGRERKSIISDCMEALIGAIYLDGGLEAAKAFIEKYILYDIENTRFFSDNKSALQEILQANMGVPKYQLVKESGPSHDKLFTVRVKLGNKVLGEGCAHSKKEAEQIAAGVALKKLQEG